MCIISGETINLERSAAGGVDFGGHQEVHAPDRRARSPLL